MTEKYDPYANAIAERVNGILKQEFFVSDFDISIKLKKLLIKETVNIYNSLRPHTLCEMLTPNQMHMQNEIIKPSYSKTKSANQVHLIC